MNARVKALPHPIQHLVLACLAYWDWLHDGQSDTQAPPNPDTTYDDIREWALADDLTPVKLDDQATASHEVPVDALMTRLLGLILRWRADISPTCPAGPMSSVYERCTRELMEAAGIVELDRTDRLPTGSYSIADTASPASAHNFPRASTTTEVEADLEAVAAAALMTASKPTNDWMHPWQRITVLCADRLGGVAPQTPAEPTLTVPIPDFDSLDFSTASVFQDFSYEHLPPPMQGVSRQFHALACWLIANTPQNPKRTTALNKLVEAKDYAVRSTCDKVSDGLARTWRMPARKD